MSHPADAAPNPHLPPAPLNPPLPQTIHRRRRLIIAGSSVAGVAAVAVAVVSFVLFGHGDKHSKRIATTSRSAHSSGPERRCARAAPVQALARIGCRLRIPARAGARRQAGGPARRGQGAHRSRERGGQRSHRPRAPGPAPLQQRVALRGQQFHQPGAAELLRRQSLPPADDVANARRAAVRRPEGRRNRRPRLSVRQRIPHR